MCNGNSPSSRSLRLVLEMRQQFACNSRSVACVTMWQRMHTWRTSVPLPLQRFPFFVPRLGACVRGHHGRLHRIRAVRRKWKRLLALAVPPSRYFCGPLGLAFVAGRVPITFGKKVHSIEFAAPRHTTRRLERLSAVQSTHPIRFICALNL